MKKIELDIQCQACHGTGVYVGIAERDGAAVVCRKCGGTGLYKYKFEYEEFSARKEAEGVTRVYKQSYGYVIAPREIDFEGVGKIDMSTEGVPYDDFKKGLLPKHSEKLVCPMLADQSACHKIKGFVDKCDTLNGGSLLGIRLTSCRYQPFKDQCWKRFYTEI